jgi:peptide/nickel transport system substrate-binding protein
MSPLGRKENEMQKRLLLLIGLLLVFAVALAACAPETETVEVTRVVTETETVTEEVAVEVTRVVTEMETVTEEVTRVVTEEVVVEVPSDVSGVVLPRNETLYSNGQQWSPIVCWNPYSSNCNNAMAIAQQDSARVIMFETPYAYNMLDGKQYPLLADGDYEWNEDQTEITFKIKPAAHWSDGTPVTAEDVAYTWDSNVKYETNAGANFGEYIESVTAVDPQTVLVKAKLDESGQAVNPLLVASYLSGNYVIQKAWTETLEARAGGDPAAFKADGATDVVWSGPYTRFFDDDSKVVYIRDDNYWGQDESMFGKLPVPKYLAHQIFKDNAAGFIALQAGEVDVSQQFNANVQDLWLGRQSANRLLQSDIPWFGQSCRPQGDRHGC